MDVAKWHLVEGNDTVGPLSAREVRERMRSTSGEPVLVWTDGMADWADASSIAELSDPREPETPAAETHALETPAVGDHAAADEPRPRRDRGGDDPVQPRALTCGA